MDRLRSCTYLLNSFFWLPGAHQRRRCAEQQVQVGSTRAPAGLHRMQGVLTSPQDTAVASHDTHRDRIVVNALSLHLRSGARREDGGARRVHLLCPAVSVATATTAMHHRVRGRHTTPQSPLPQRPTHQYSTINVFAMVTDTRLAGFPGCMKARATAPTCPLFMDLIAF